MNVRVLPVTLLTCGIALGSACGSEPAPRSPRSPQATHRDGGTDGPSSSGDAMGDVREGGEPDAGQLDAATGPSIARCLYPDVSDEDVLAALEAGDGSAVPSSDQLIDATRHALAVARTHMDPALRALFGLADDGSAGAQSLTAVDWDPRHDAATFRATPGENAAALWTDDAGSGPEALAVVGESGASRYLVLGGNPFRTDPERGNSSVVNGQMDSWLGNAVHWLTGTAADDPKRVVLAHLDDSYWFADDSSTRDWFARTFGERVTMNEEGACDGDALSGCVHASPDLLILSQFHDPEIHEPQQIAKAVEDALSAGVAVLYIQHDGSLNGLGRQLLQRLQVSYLRDNAWKKLRVTEFDGRQALGWLPESHAQIDTALEHLASGAYDFSLAEVAADPGGHDAYQAQFGQGASAVRSLLKQHDEAGTELFADCTHGIDKLLVLLGDRLRQDIRYPMSHAHTDTGEFLRAYFADHAVYASRASAPAQPDRGNFDPGDFSAVLGVDKKVQLTSRPNFRSLGAYLLPGRAARITRLDDHAVHTKIFVNTIRDGATHEWDGSDHAYPRPKFLQSAWIPLAPGETLVLSHPYGGPLQVAFDESGVDVELQLENVGEHPHWRSSEDDERFARTLAEGAYHWVEVATAGFELHSRRDKFEQTMRDERWNTPAKLAAVIEKYTFEEVHIMAGFSGDGISERAEVHGWADAHGLDVPVLDVVKHANMDQASCGSGCSGNPYDAYWDFSPIGHGDLHELGHSLQNGRFQLSHGGRQYANHAVTNWSPFYTASRYYEDHGTDVPEWKIPHAHLFAELQAAHVAGERAGDFSTHMSAYLGDAIANKGEIRNCYAFFMQAGMAARHAGVVDNGYHLVPRVHIFDRAFRRALQDDAGWVEARVGVGFDQFEHAQAQAITNNDFMLVAMSFVMGLDYRDYFAMWGVEVSETAQAQVASLGFDAVPRAFFAMSDVDHAHAALSTEFGRIERLVIDGVSDWPAP